MPVIRAIVLFCFAFLFACGTTAESFDDWAEATTFIDLTEEQAVADVRLAEKQAANVRGSHARHPFRQPLGDFAPIALLGKQPTWIASGPFFAPESCAKGPDGMWYFGSIAPSTQSYDELDSLGWINRFNGAGQPVAGENGSLDTMWLSGLHGALGMLWVGPKLYVADADGLNRIVDVGGVGSYEMIVAVPTRINDIAGPGPAGELYLSDPANNRIYKVANPSGPAPTVSTWLQSPSLTAPNGLFVDLALGKLFVASMGDYDGDAPFGKVLSITISTKAILSLPFSQLGKFDGIAGISATQLMVTDIVTGSVSRVSKTSGSSSTLQNWGSAADIASDGVTVCVPGLNTNSAGIVTVAP